jgi:xanthine/CO dehydrogenase XdhC/CoxF family maturation factor
MLEELERLAQQGKTFTLCVVVHSSGSTYRKAGALALVTADGMRYGVISGGCLESGLESAAASALKQERPALLRFDTEGDDDLIFGSGSGCRGRMQVLLLPVTAAGSHALCQGLLSAQRAHQSLKTALVIGGRQLGSGFVWFGNTEAELPPHVPAARILRDRPAGEHLLPDGSSWAVLAFEPSPRLLLLGAGPEAPALIGIARQLGWLVTIADHRALPLEAHGVCAERRICAHPHEALAALADEPFDACVVMTHTAANDREALLALARRNEPFVGLLGPATRRDELLRELDGTTRALLAPRLHAPVGLRLGGYGPEALALSICAELQRFLVAGRNATAAALASGA